MATFKDVLEVRDRPYNRAMKVTVIAPKLPPRKRLEALAQQAWDAPSKTVTVGSVIVKVEAFKR